MKRDEIRVMRLATEVSLTTILELLMVVGVDSSEGLVG